MSRFFCLCLPDFAAWAAIQTKPSLQGKPLLVHSNARVVAASPEARAGGVQTGWSLGRAQSLVPDAVTLPVHGPTVRAAWNEVLTQLYELTPNVESLRQEMTRRNHGRSAAQVSSHKIAMMQFVPKDALLSLTRKWGAQAGIADDRSTAELAALTAPPGKVRDVAADNSILFLQRVPVSTLGAVGVSGDTIERLGWFGWHSVGHLRPLTKRQLSAQFAESDVLHRYGQAVDVRPIPHYYLPAFITVRYQFEEAVREPHQIEPVLQLLLEQAWCQLEEQEVGSISVAADTVVGWQRSTRLLREPTAALRPLYAASQYALQGALSYDESINGLEVCLSNLAPPQPVQGHLFGAARPSVQEAIRAVEVRFTGALRRIVIINPDAYLPEESFRFEPVTLPSVSTEKQSKAAGRTQPVRAVIRPRRFSPQRSQRELFA